MRCRLNNLRTTLLYAAVLLSALHGVAEGLDEKHLKALMDKGSSSLIAMQQEQQGIPQDADHRDIAKEIKDRINQEQRRCKEVKRAILDLLPNVMKSKKIDMRDAQGRTLLMLVASLGNDEATELVLRENPDLSLFDNDEKIAYDYEQTGGGNAIGNLLKKQWEEAFRNGHNRDTLQELINRGANPDWSIEGNPPLGVAMELEDSELFDILLFAGAHANNRMQNGLSLIEMAVQRHDANAVFGILNALNKTDIVFSDGRSIFRHLLSAEQAECLSTWLNKAVELKQEETEDGTSYLCLVVRLAHPAGVKAALKSHADRLNEADREGNMPLHEAARRGDTTIYRTLIELGALPTATNHRHETVLMHACLSGNPEMLTEVLSNITPEQLNATDKDGHTAHYYAKLAKNTAATQALQAAGLNPNRKD